MSTPCACGAALAPGDRFCPACGRRAQPGAAGRSPWPWAFAVTMLALAGIVWVMSRPRPGVSVPAGAGTPALTGPAPDISSMSPRQAFDRLYDRVMAAADAGDTATVIRLTTHAFSAYGQVPSPDADARYHAAVLHAQVGDFGPALALADTILAETPEHLLGLLIRGTVAELRGDRDALAAVRRDFLAVWRRDPGTGRPEYLDHSAVLNEFQQSAARGATP